MATYSTGSNVLTTLNTMETATFTEFAAPYNGAGNPGASGEQFIQGTDCYAQNTGKASGLEISCVYDHGSNVTFATDEVVFAWLFYFAGTNLETYANSGWRFGIGSSTSAWDWFRVGGSDYSSHKYGGWFNFAVDPTATESGTIGGGNGGNYRYFGNVPFTLNEVTKGDPLAVDAIRVGRGTLSITGTGGTFSELGDYNDYNAGGTPPGTTSTVIDGGFHVLGLFQPQGGTYLWKGLLSFGTSADSCSFDDANETIIIDDCPHTYPSFNKIEVRNVDSIVKWDNITILSIQTTTNGRGDFQMVENAEVTQSNCVFTDMGTFLYSSNATMDTTTWRRCDIVYQSGSTITGCTFDSTNASVAVSGSNPSLVTNTTFISNGSSHAYEIDTTGTYNWTNNIVEGYETANGSTGNEVIYNTSGGAVTINKSGGAGTVSYRNLGASTTTVNDTVNVTLTGMQENTEVRVLAFGTNTELAGIENATAGTSGSREFTFSLNASTATTIKVHAVSWEHISIDYTVPTTAASIPIQQRFDRNYLNP